MRPNVLCGLISIKTACKGLKRSSEFTANGSGDKPDFEPSVQDTKCEANQIFRYAYTIIKLLSTIHLKNVM